ncbi:MAG: penicillin-binding protein 2 [Myxococcota bacterium]|nr:penicillin-binding protein 2 [Myxococcota bacterium]
MSRQDRAFRALAFGGLVLTAFALLAGRVAWLALVAHERASEAINRQVITEEPIPHERGRILDRNRRVIVNSMPAIDLWVDGKRALQTGPRLRRLSRRLGIPPKAFDEPRKLLATRALMGNPEEVEVVVGRPVSPTQVSYLPGVRAERDSVFINPLDFPSSERLVFRLHRYLNLSLRRRRLLANRIEYAGSRERLLVSDIPNGAWHAIAAEVSVGRLKGIIVRQGRRRAYRYDRLAYHVLGYMNEVTEEELKVGAGTFKTGELIGRTGVERRMEAYLRGTDGIRYVVRDSRGNPVKGQWAEELLGDTHRLEPRGGHDVELTLELEVQKAAEKSFTGRRGAVVVMDVRNGEVLAMASFPTPDPNRIRQSAYNRAVITHGDKPLVNRVLADHYAPASTFKVVTALAGLREGTIRPHYGAYCPGQFTLGETTWACWHRPGHGALDVAGAIRHSCNVFFYKLAERLGMDPILDTARVLGFGEMAGLSLGPEVNGVLPTDSYCRTRKYWIDERGRKHPLSCTLGDAINASIGQGFITTTPYQLALAYARIASGNSIQARIVRRVVTDKDEQLVDNREVEPPRLDIPEAHLEVVREGLRQVVNDERGTAYRAFHLDSASGGAVRLRQAGIEVAGKTGTAQVRKLRRDRHGVKIRTDDYASQDHAWFAGFAPAKDPVVAVAVFVEHGGSGGKAAAPIAFEVLASVLVPEEQG